MHLQLFYLFCQILIERNRLTRCLVQFIWGLFQKAGLVGVWLRIEKLWTVQLRVYGFRKHAQSWSNQFWAKFTPSCAYAWRSKKHCQWMQITWFAMATSVKKPWPSHLSPLEMKEFTWLDCVYRKCAFFSRKKVILQQTKEVMWLKMTDWACEIKKTERHVWSWLFTSFNISILCVLEPQQQHSRHQMELAEN